MHTLLASTPQSERQPRAERRLLLRGSLFAALLGASAGAGCNHDWSAYDPRLGGEGGTAGSAAASGSNAGGSLSGSAGTSGPSGGSAGSGAAGPGGTSTGGTMTAGGSGGAGGTSTHGGAAGTSSSSSGGSGGAVSSSSGGASGNAGASGEGGSAGSGGGPLDPCGGTSALAEDFTGSDISFVWNTDEWNGASLGQSGGELVIDLPINAPDGAGANFYTDRYYNFRNDSVSVEVTSVGNMASTAWGAFGIGMNNDNYIEIYAEEGVLHFGLEVNDDYTSLKTTMYDPAVHRHWRFREDGANTYLETSSDGMSWTTHVQIPSNTLFPLDLVGVQLSGGTDVPEMSPGQIHFDRLNGGGAPKQKLCKVGSFTDDFNDGLRSREWDRTWENIDGMMGESGGHLVCSLVPDNAAYAAYYSSRGFDLTGSSLVVEVPQTPPSGLPGASFIGLDGPDSTELEMRLSGGQLELHVVLAGGDDQKLGSVLYSAAAHRWWRIRESGGTVYYETAPDGKLWSTRAEIPVPFAIDALDLYLGAGAYQNVPSPGAAHYDNLNLPPP